MKRTSTLIIICLLAVGSLLGGSTPLTNGDLTTPVGKELTANIPLLLHPGMDVQVDGSRLRITALKDSWSGQGTLHFPALNLEINVDFNNLEVNAFGRILKGAIQARPQVLGADQEATFTRRETLPLNITSHLRSRLNYELPQGSAMDLTDLTVTENGTFIGLDFDTPTLVEDDMLSFTGKRLKVDAETFCLEDTELAITAGGGFIDDFEFPMRILAGDPNEEDEGSYVTFDCDGFKEFSLSAEYPFPRSQVVPARNARDTVFARFRIQATRLGNFVAFATVTPFEVPGVDDMIFTIDSAYVDYSDAANARGFAINPLTGEAPEMSWKGIFLRRLQVTLPESVSAFSKEGEELTIGGENIVYSRGNGLSGNLYVYNLLDLSTGNLGGWGVSIDTLETDLVRNSVGNFDFRGEVFIPVFDREDKIEYNALLSTDAAGESSLTFVLDVEGSYAVPFLGDIFMELDEGSRAGVRFGERGFEPFLSASGLINLTLSGSVGGIEIPTVDLPNLRFQDFKLNDTELSYTQSQSTVTAGIDRMSFGAFDWAGINLGAVNDAVSGAMDAANQAQAVQNAANGQGAQKKVNGKPISIEDISFETVLVNGQELKELKLHTKMNFTKGSGGIAGELKFGVQGEVDYAELVSFTPWNALSFHGLKFGSVDINARFSNVRFAGALNIFNEDPIHGKGWKGGLEVEIKMASKTIEVSGMGQFGSAPGDDSFDYFFVDIRTEFRPGIPMGPVELIGFGGGLYYNMSKSVTTDVEFGGENPTINSVPGQSFSGARYRPRENLIGLALSTAMQFKSKPEVFSGDLELTFEFNTSPTFGVRKILFAGTGYFLNKDRENRRKASIQAVLAMELNIEQAFLSANFAYEVRAPYDNPLLVGGGLDGEPQGSLLIDLNSDDEYEWSSHFYFGKPRRPADLGVRLAGIGELRADAYFMIGADLPDPLPLAEVHPRLADFPDMSRSQGSSDIGLAFGVKVSSSGEASAGPVSLYWDIVLGMDATIRRFNGVTCANTGDEIGMNGWYIKGRAFAYVRAGVKLHVQLDFGLFEIDEVVTLADLEVAASLVGELPNPSYFGGKVRVTASAMGFSVTKSVSIELGEKCDAQDDLGAAAAVADIEVINGIFPEEGSDDASEFEIFETPIISFAYPVSIDPSEPFSAESMLVFPYEDENEELFVNSYFPYLKEAVLLDSLDRDVGSTFKWDETHNLLELERREVLAPMSSYKLKVTVRWRFRSGSEGPWVDLTDRNGNKIDETQEIEITTNEFPTNINLVMLEADRHFPGNRQRHWHQDFGPGEFYFNQSGLDDIFASVVTKTIGDESKEVDVRYAVALTDVETGETREIPITERPGDFQLEELVSQSYSYEVPRDRTGGVARVSYTKLEKRTYNSRGVKYNGINADDYLRNGAIYKFSIMRIPTAGEVDSGNVAVDRETITEEAGASGVVVQSTEVNITSQTDPFLLPEAIYTFHFGVSRYDNLQAKLADLRFVTKSEGKALKGIDDPLVENVTRTDIAGYPAKNDMRGIRDDYFVYRINEGFDWWERQRLTTNMRMEEPAINPYYTTSSGQLLRKAAEKGASMESMPEVWRTAFNTQFPQDEDDVWASVTFPNEPEGQYPQLSDEEVDNARMNSFYLGNLRAEDGNYMGSGKWDLAVVHKGKRTLAFQAACVAMMARTFYANDDFYKKKYATAQSGSSSHVSLGVGPGVGTSSSYSYAPSYPPIATMNLIWEESFIQTGFAEFSPDPNSPSPAPQINAKSWAGRTSQGPRGIVLNQKVTETKTKTTGYVVASSSSSTEIKQLYSSFQHTWRNQNRYSLPSSSVVQAMESSMWGHGALLRPFGGYDAPIIFHFKDRYTSLTEKVENAQSITLPLSGLMRIQ